MKVRDKNTILAGLIRKLDEKGRQENVPLWGALAEKLNRPRRIAYEVNLSTLERHAKAKEKIIVPGYVLGTGALTKPLTVAALKFSRIAEERIKKAGGSSMSIEKFIDENPKAKGIRIMG